MVKKSYEFADLFSQREREEELEERKNKIERSKKVNFDEQYYFRDKPDWLLGLYKKIDDYCLNGIKKGVERTFLKTYIRWTYKGKMFCRIFVFKDNLKVYLKLKYAELENPPAFIRDYSEKVRGISTIEILLDEEYLQNEEAFSAVIFSLIEKSFSEIAGTRRLRPVKKRSLEPVKSIEISGPSSINLSVDDNGYITINLKIKKNQKEILNRILQETIFK